MSERPFDPTQFIERAREGWNAAAIGWKAWAPTIEKGAQIVNGRLVKETSSCLPPSSSKTSSKG